jgi:hypothetical protein
LKRDCRDCIHSTASADPKCRHPRNLRADLFEEHPIFIYCFGHREFGGEDEKRMPSICGKSGRWWDNGEKK